jgi:predicted dehydrogenase
VKPSVAFIGLGVMGHRMLTNMAAHGGFRLASAWDPSAEACRTVAAQYAGIAIADNADEIINAPETDVVYIACPPIAHRGYALAAADAGKAVFCEKPLGVSVDDSREMVERIEASGVINAVNFPFADAEAINLLQQRLNNGALGTLMGVDIRIHFATWPRGWQETATWLAMRQEGGFVREVLSHYVYLTEKLFGPAQLIDAAVTYPEDERLCETHVVALIDCAGLPVSTIINAGGVGPDVIEYTVWGSKSSYRLWDWNRLKSTSGGDWADELTDFEDPRQDGYGRVLDNFLAQLGGKPHSMPHFRDALSVQALIEAILNY